MRCNEARKLLTEGIDRSAPDLAAHLEVCAECQRVASASRELNSLLDTARGEIPIVEFGVIRRRAETAAGSQSRWENIMSRLAHRSNEHRRLITGIGFALVVFLIVTLIPFSYTAVTGYQITLTGEERLEVSPDLLTAALTAVGYEDITVTEGELAGQYVLSGLANEQEAQNIAVALAGLSGSNRVPAVEPIEGKLSGTIYAQAAKRIIADEKGPIRIKLEEGRFVISDSTLKGLLFSSDATDDEIESGIRKFLDAQGNFAGEVIVSAEIDEAQNYRLIKLSTEDGSLSSSPDIRMYMSKGVLALESRSGDSTESLAQLIDIFANGDLDSLAEELDRGIILELPGGKEVGGEAVTIRVHLVPRDDPDVEE